ncbi:MAG: hypothetical protein WDW38_002300 [Sanguina aurantia]
MLAYDHSSSPAAPAHPSSDSHNTVTHFTSLRCPGVADFKGELSHLQGELMCLFLELLRTLVQNPSGYAPQLTMINQVFSNMQHLINALRPHQARANLEYALQLQIQAHKDALARIAQQVAAADTTLAQFAAALVNAQGDAAESAVSVQAAGDTPALMDCT